MNRARTAILPIVLAIIAGGLLRFYHLEAMPVHVDESEHAYVLGKALQGDPYQFSPKHHHGPTMHYAFRISTWLSNRSGFADLEIIHLRAVPAIASIITLALIALLAARIGSATGQCAVILAAFSPYLLYYNRVAIHESLLVLFAIVFLILIRSYLHRPRSCTAVGIGIAAGLLIATKLTSVIFFFSVGSAGIIAGWLCFKNSSLKEIELPPAQAFKVHHLGTALAGFAIIYTVFYSSFFSNWRGLLDAITTFGKYQVEEGHNKPWDYFFRILLMPQHSLGTWQWEPFLIIGGIFGFIVSWFDHKDPANTLWVRVLGLSALIQIAVYSSISYKTPWLLMIPWAQMAIVAGYGIDRLFRQKQRWIPWGVTLVIMALAMFQINEMRLRVFRYPSDPRNPFAYSSTLPGISDLGDFVQKLVRLRPDEPASVQVIGEDVWPLPWYLRKVQNVTYLNEIPNADLSTLLIVTPNHLEQFQHRTKGKYVDLLYPLRSGYPLHLMVQSGLWETWQNSDPTESDDGN